MSYISLDNWSLTSAWEKLLVKCLLTERVHELTKEPRREARPWWCYGLCKTPTFIPALKHSAWLTCPAFLNLDAIAPATAWSTLALSKTMNGARPPSSMETRFTEFAAWCSRICRVQRENTVSIQINLQGVTVCLESTFLPDGLGV